MSAMKYNKYASFKLSKNFNTDEFACKCSKCHETLIDTRLVEKLQNIRNLLRCPINITSAFRCEAHQQELKAQGYPTATGKSTHELGQAVDILYPTCVSKEDFLEMLRKEFKALGIAKGFVHIDLRDDKKREWYYV